MFEIWKCKKCQWTCHAGPKGSIGTAHSHAEKHAPGTILGKKIPTRFWPTADPQILGQYVQKLKVTEYTEVDQ